MSERNRMTRRGYSPVAFFIVITMCLIGITPFGFIAGQRVFAGDSSGEASSPLVLVFRGATMGTTYSVKVSDPPPGDDWASEAALTIEAELRRVNDQMSTYLKSSELSRFNASTSTDWFDVSQETADVVAFALEVGAASDGRFDVTVGPLVDRWSFGPGKRNRDVPSDEELDEIGQRIGQQHLAVRRDPPALKKDIAQLRVDLSAIAKGHGVDRVVELLLSLGAKNVFVEIGGEVRVTGAKQSAGGSQPWRVGIQKPDAASNEIVLAHPMEDSAMATSGDYRNFFEVDGERYSHTIDPVTRRPVRHDLASVTVIAPTCMAADAWATALNVVGPEMAVDLANENNLDTLLITRGVVADVTQSDVPNQNEGIQMNVMGTGSLAVVAERMMATAMTAQAAPADPGFGTRWMPILVLTGIGFAAMLIAMAVGVMFGRKSIGGSCGGLNARTDPDGVSRCSMCSTPSEGCKELREKIENGQFDAKAGE
ncbi:FAD:protein FMN transferase [Aporhodopirellula aestuarii]|uniref:FAD:protein FMN transferase n=1 Tax=Aporhodopirellula aestuarii TaxID=2950107 RepID=A0ABT0U5H6_9BACT|nr:FAD:protein FMN transferase [Aporhodopirellula aestuarii]MCM2372170.1 FAD:protein FMN transferase [Aporhodopirellula aestuarii]